jgi:hypothetical protein
LGEKAKSSTTSGTISCASVILAANQTRFRASPVAGPALGDDNDLRTSVKFEDAIVSHTFASIACRAISNWSLSRPQIFTSKSAGLSVLYGTSAGVS